MNQQPKHNDKHKSKPFDPIAELVAPDLAKLSQEQRDISYIFVYLCHICIICTRHIRPCTCDRRRHHGLCQTQRNTRHDLFRPYPVFAKNLLDHTDFRHYRLLHLVFTNWFPDYSTNLGVVCLPRCVWLLAPA